MSKDDSREIISTVDYDESNPVYQKIKKNFTNKLKEKYECENYEEIVKYVFDFVFQKKSTKASCIQNLNSIFNDKASGIMDYLWEITREAENEQQGSEGYEDDSYQEQDNRFGRGFNRRGIRPDRNDRGSKGRFGGNNKFGPDKIRKGSKDGKYYNKNKMEHSRSRSRENVYDYDSYQTYPTQPKGFYPPKGRFSRPMMPMTAPYPTYYPPRQMMPPYIQR